jgi:hypothetical protein
MVFTMQIRFLTVAPYVQHASSAAYGQTRANFQKPEIAMWSAREPSEKTKRTDN